MRHAAFQANVHLCECVSVSGAGIHTLCDHDCVFLRSGIYVITNLLIFKANGHTQVLHEHTIKL